jgi:hypothetical protein
MSRKPKITFVAVLLMVVSLTCLSFARNNEDVPVSCYLGTHEQYEEVGTLEVFDPSRNAVGLCNAIYNDCNGRCWACWTDSEGQAVCRDLSGAQFLR